MKFHLMSDLHLEHRAPSEVQAFFKRLDQQIAAEPVANTVVLAGDIGSMYYMDQLVEYLAEFAKRYQDVIYVGGNHEFFHQSIVDAPKELQKKIDAQNALTDRGIIHFLKPGDRVAIDGKIFAGGTGWYVDCGDRYMKRQWIDYNRIDDCDPEAHGENKNFVEKNLQPGVDVLVSHMLPTEECVSARWIGQWTNCFFLMGIEDQLSALPKENMPRLWVFGHTHDPKDFVSKYGFRARCNPLGYPYEGANPGFWDQLIVEI